MKKCCRALVIIGGSCRQAILEENQDYCYYHQKLKRGLTTPCHPGYDPGFEISLISYPLKGEKITYWEQIEL